jgi:predicted nucleotidyltransferase
MTLRDEYARARRSENLSRVRRAIALRAMVATGMTQREIAETLGISQPAVNQQLRTAPELAQFPGDELLEAARPILKELARAHGYTKLAVYGSIARGEAGFQSDIDLLVRAPRGTSSFDFVAFKKLLESVLDRSVDLIEYGGLKSGIDEDIRREAVVL